MQIPCVSCQSLFRFNSDLVKPTGSLVKCSKCKYIFMVYPPTFNDEPILQDTNIDQSILFDLFKVEQKDWAKEVFDQTSAMMNSHRVDEIASIEDFEEEEEYPDVAGKTEYPELPDISEYEKMIDWDDIPDTEDFSEGEKHFYNSGDNNELGFYHEIKFKMPN